MSTAEELRELAQRGVGFDMNPTMMFTTAESMYSQWLDYFGRHDKAWRERVAAAADAPSSPPADEDGESGQRSGECEHDDHAVCDGTTPGWPCDCSCHTPPADDVREALTRRIADEVEYRVRTAVTLAVNGHEYEQHVTQGRESVAEILAKVRPRGTVTDDEGTWECGVRHVAVDGWPTERAHVSLEDARADLDTCGMNCHLIRRSSAGDAGPWESFDATGEARS